MNESLWIVHAFVEGLFVGGVRRAVVSPGSRNTPLTIALAEHPGIEVFTHLDERSAAFFALGLAKASGEPVVIECTSGTATANYYPAVIEANESRVPLVVVTADRPHQLREIGANQAIHQPQMYAANVKRAIELPVPDGNVDSARYAASMAARATAFACERPAGPVHINYPFVEPLLPPKREEARLHHARPARIVPSRPPEPEPHVLHELEQVLSHAARPVIVVGPMHDASLARAVASFAERFEIPLFPDILSQVRGAKGNHVIRHFDLLLSAQSNLMKSDVVLRFGAEPTSKAMSSVLSRLPEQTRVFANDETSWYRDATLATHDVIVGDMTRWLEMSMLSMSDDARAYAQFWRKLDDGASKLVRRFVDEHWFEGAAVQTVVEAVPKHGRCFLGNSRPIRDADALAIPVFGAVMDANRGASGIDGVTSTAFGESLAKPNQPTVLCIGDVSFYHDLNGLLAASQFHGSLTVVLIHNEGGGIFQHLSQASRSDMLHYFTTPHQLQFEPIVQGFGGTYTSVDNAKALRGEIIKSIDRQGLHVIEAHFTNDAGASLYRELRKQLTELLQSGDT